MGWTYIKSLHGSKGTTGSAGSNATVDPTTVGPNWFVPQYVPGNYYFCNCAATANVASPSGFWVYVSPWVVTANVTITSLFGEFTAAGTNSGYRIGIWNDDGYCRPGTLRYDAGSFPSTGTPGVMEISGFSLSLTPGLYWVGGKSFNGGTYRLIAQGGTIPFTAPLGTSLPISSAMTIGWALNVGSGNNPFTDWNAANQVLGLYAARIGFKVAA